MEEVTLDNIIFTHRAHALRPGRGISGSRGSRTHLAFARRREYENVIRNCFIITSSKENLLKDDKRMIDNKVLFEIIDKSIQQRGYRLITEKPDLKISGDSIFEYKRTDPPRMNISAVWNSDKEKGYFMIQLSYRRKIYEQGMFLIRFRDLKDEDELIDDMNGIFKHWKQ